MKFDTPATKNPIDQLKVVGKPTSRIDGPVKTSGSALYGYEHQDVADSQVYGYIVAAGIAKGKIKSMDLTAAKKAPGVINVLTAKNAGTLGKGKFNVAKLLAGPEIEHYHQAIALVIAQTFEQARHAAHLVKITYTPVKGRYDLAKEAKSAPAVSGDSDEGSAGPAIKRIGKFEEAYASSPVKLDAIYTTPDQTHAMMEPHASMAAWNGGKLTLWTSNQMIDWGASDVAKTLNISRDNIRLISPYVGGGFGGKLFVRSDAILAALGARLVGRPVKVALPRPLIANNTTHRPATIQHIQIGATQDGKITAIAHESTSGNLPDGKPETATQQTELLYAGANRKITLKLAELDLPEGNAMRAPGEAPGLMALEVAMDEMAEKLNLDPVAFRRINDTQVDPNKPDRRSPSAI